MRKNLFIAIFVVVGAVLAAGASLSCSSVRCGDQTHEVNGVCVYNAPVVCGKGTVPSAGSCIPGDFPDICGPNTVWNPETHQCDGQNGGGNEDGGVLPSKGVRWTGFQLIEPASIAPVANLQLPSYFADGTIVILMAASADKTQLFGGSGAKVSSDPLTYGMASGFLLNDVAGDENAVKIAVTGTDFVTDPDGRFDWSFTFLPSQPNLDIRNASVGGKIDAAGFTTSEGYAGTYSGCITDASAEAVYIEVLGQTLKALIAANGGVVDCDASGGGTNDGYHLVAKWESTEIVDFQWGAAATDTDGGTP